MKFSKELDRTLVPEWQPKYFDYRLGKKHIKGIAGLNRRLDKLTADLEHQAKSSETESFNILKIHESDTTGDISLGSYSPTRQKASNTNDKETALPQHAPARRGSLIPDWITNVIYLPQTEEYHVKTVQEVENQMCDQKRQFGQYLEVERDKIEAFYNLKENEAGRRLNLLKYQLQEMQLEREIETGKTGFTKKNRVSTADKGSTTTSWVTSAASSFGFEPQQAAKTSSILNANQPQAREYLRQDSQKVPYNLGKRQLRIAVQEYYRALHMLKEYSTLNKKAFEKINKKYAKVAGRQSCSVVFDTGIYDSYFVQSTLVDTYIAETEDVYTQCFENGNHKAAANKLRAAIQKLSDGTLDSFNNGMMLGIAGILLGQAIYNAVLLLRDPDELIHIKTRLLLQIYGGYFLMVYLFILFCLSCRIWKNNHINYTFILEFNRRHTLPVAKMSQYPIGFFLLLALFMWLNFHRIAARIFVYWPTILLGATALVLFFPAPILAFKSRKWLILLHCRLLLAGLITVEFGDVFLGDMYTSLGFSEGNIGFYFCIYSIHFLDETSCDNKHIFGSSLVAALPAIWRLLQCLRRFFDSKAIFLHLVNAGKYAVSILFIVALSYYRLDGSFYNLVHLIAAGTVNTVYGSLWDLLMDFSLLDPDSSLLRPALRPVRAFKSKKIYVIIAILDPLLRCTWIFSTLYAHNPTVSVLINFLVGFGEVTRRGMWMVLRVENEHCGNMGGLKAYREMELPYNLITRQQLESFQCGEKNVDIEEQAEVKKKNRWTAYIAEAHKHEFTYRRRGSQNWGHGYR